MSYFLSTLFLIFCSTFLTAQTDSTSLYAKSPVYAHIGLGALPVVDLFSVELSVALGYRFSPHVSLGFEYRGSTVSTISTSSGASLFGLHLSGQVSEGWTAKVGIGAVVGAYMVDDGFQEYQYRAGGHYLATDWGHQFRSGLTLGLYITIVQGQSFDESLLNFDTSIHEPTGGIADDEFTSVGLKIGYAFPRQPKRRR